jgi:hypothetical protein
MRARARRQASGAARLEVWHASKVLDWAHPYEEDVRLDLAQAEEDLQRARSRQREVEEAEKDALNALTASGADQPTLIRERIERAQEKQRDIETRAKATAPRQRPSCSIVSR